jgi:hypothetical protein
VILVRYEAVLMHLRDDKLRVMEAAEAHPHPSVVQAALPGVTERQSMASIRGRRGNLILGPSCRDPGNRTLNIEGEVINNDISNGEALASDEYRVTNRRER